MKTSFTKFNAATMARGFVRHHVPKLPEGKADAMARALKYQFLKTFKIGIEEGRGLERRDIRKGRKQ